MSKAHDQANNTHLVVDIIFAAVENPRGTGVGVAVVAVAESGARMGAPEDEACLAHLTLWTSSGSLLDLAITTPAALWGRRYGCATARGSVCTGDMRARRGPTALWNAPLGPADGEPEGGLALVPT